MNTKLSCSLIFSLVLGSSTAWASLGQHTAQQLQKNHDATPLDCGSSALPAYACSGVLLRATKPSPRYHTWHHSPNSKAKGGVSFSYLRTDIPTTHLAADSNARSGFILYPDQQRPAQSLPYQVLCALPTDGDTWTRDAQGCGNNSRTPIVETACHLQGVLTAEDWIAQFRQSRDHTRQCAFDTRPERDQARADAFHQSLRVKQLHAQELPHPWNELIVATWDEAQSHRLPIQSFFYIEGLENALQQAREDQLDWHRSHEAYIPIIRIRLPDNAEQRAVFSYHESDQVVSVR